MATKKKKKQPLKPKKPARTRPVMLTPVPPPGAPALGTEDLELQGPPPSSQFVTAEDLREIIDQSERNRLGRETAEALVARQTEELEALANKIKAQRPVRFDDQKVARVSDAMLLALIMDLKGALLPLSLQSTEAAQALLRIQKLELELAPMVTAATVVLQRAKTLAQRKAEGLEVTLEDLEDLMVQAGRLL